MDAAFGPTFRGDRPDERAPTASMDSKTTESAASPDRHEHASTTLLQLPDVIHAFAVGTATSDGALSNDKTPTMLCQSMWSTALPPMVRMRTA